MSLLQFFLVISVNFVTYLSISSWHELITCKLELYYLQMSKNVTGIQSPKTRLRAMKYFKDKIAADELIAKHVSQTNYTNMGRCR